MQWVPQSLLSGWGNLEGIFGGLGLLSVGLSFFIAWTGAPAFLVAALASTGLAAEGTLLSGAIVSSVFGLISSIPLGLFSSEADARLETTKAQARYADQATLQLNLAARAFIQYQNGRAKDRAEATKAYQDCTEKMKGDPIKSALKNANAAVAKVSKRMTGVKGENKGSLVLQGDGTRFRFYERFYAQRLDMAPFRERLHLPTPELAWTRQSS